MSAQRASASEGGELPGPERAGGNREVHALRTLVRAVQELSLARSIEAIAAVVRRAARELTGADGATFVLREGTQCFYVDEDAIAPLWKGKRFAMSACVSGWVMQRGRPAVIDDIYADDRVPAEAYRATFVKSLAMVPIRASSPIGAIGNYWASGHHATAREVELLQALADSTSTAMENVQLYGELERRAREAERNAALRDDFLVIAGHELKTPLTAMLLRLESLELAAARGRPVLLDAERANKVLGPARRLARLVAEVLEVSRISTGRLVLQRERFDIAELAREVAERFADEAARLGSPIDCACADAAVGEWDRERIDHVLTNLLGNALKYGAGKPVRVRVRATGPGELVEIAIGDEGIGIAPEDQPRIFGRFERAASARNYGGLGVGLWIVRSIVEAHGGRVSFTSEPGKGSTFVVRLPKSAAAGTASASGAAGPGTAANPT